MRNNDSHDYITVLENLCGAVTQEITSVGSLVDRVCFVKDKDRLSLSNENTLLSECLQSLFAELKPLNEYFKPATRKFLATKKPNFFRSDTRLHNTVVQEVTSITDSLAELTRRLNADDFRVTRLHQQRSIVLGHLEFYKLVLQDLLNTLRAPLEQATDSNRAIVDVLALARFKLERYINFPQSYIFEFDEDSYLSSNPDLRSAVLKNVFPSGLAHFVAHGLEEVKNGNRNQDHDDPVHLMVFPDRKNREGQDQIAAPASSANASQAPEPKDSDIEQCVLSLTESSQKVLEMIRQSGIVDENWYKRNVCAAEDSCAHFYLHGGLADANPNALFDYKWYGKRYLQTDVSPLKAVLHYIEQGGHNGFWPSLSFEPEWYREASGLSANGHELLAHYLAHGRSAGLSPNSVYDNQFYVDNNDDIARSTVDPFEHFNSTGWTEGRNPSKTFDLQFYRTVNLHGRTDINPVSHYLETGREDRLPINERRRSLINGKPLLQDMGANIRYFSNKSPDFEEPILNSIPPKPLVKAIAFFLPQFYPFDENNKWWGKGFTEWRNVARGAPRFAGHYQPRIPRDLGFYNLTDESTLVRQAEMALANGLEAFCFYYYWFNGKRLMEKPLDLFAASSDISLKFCIMWANENWTRTWDGFDNEVLIEQNYLEEDEDDFINDTLRYFLNERYLTVGGRPLFILYRPGLVDSAATTIARWRAKWKAISGLDPLIMMVQGFEDMDPTLYGLDGAVEFPPHKVAKNLPNIHDRLDIVDPGYQGNVVDYNDVVNKSLSEAAPGFPLLKTVSPHWDNDARREGRGFTMHGSTPANYQRWLRGAINYAVRNPFHGEALVFVNAWNEWAESAYLEPDVHYGHAYLNATRRALCGVSAFTQRESIVLAGHDAYRHGAQMLLLNIADTFKNQFGFDVLIALKRGGPLLDQYRQLATVYLMDSDDSDALCKTIAERNCSLAITNTCVTGDMVPMLKQLDLQVISLVHELPRLIDEYKLEKQVRNIASESDHIVFASEFVRRGFLSVVEETASLTHIVPQGLYQEITCDSDTASRIRLDLGITRNQKMVLNVGFADMRKGFDLFLATAREAIQRLPDVHFVWLGGVDEELQRWATPDLDGMFANRIHILEFTDNVSGYFNAADCFFLSSREDPYPSVILEAFSVGCPVIVFKSATGLENIVDQHGFIVDRNSSEQIMNALNGCLYEDDQHRKDARKELINDNYQFDDYCFSLLKLLRPDTARVSVVIPNYNYEQYIEERLLTVFAQHYPLFEIIVLEDNSPDNSLETIRNVIAATGRKVKLVVNETNSGNTFRQWERGLELARGDLLWIAEADDIASPRFVSELVASFKDDTVLGFTDSRQIDLNGELLSESYGFYYKDIDAELFSRSRSMSGKEFVKRALMIKNSILNVSSVIWRTTALKNALIAEKDAVLASRLVGDWRLYICVLLAHNARLVYLAKPLNTHRRHAASVTHILDATRHLDEVSEIHHFVKQFISPDADQLAQMEEYLRELSEQFGIQKVAASDAPGLSLAWSNDQQIAHNNVEGIHKRQKERNCDTVDDSQAS